MDNNTEKNSMSDSKLMNVSQKHNNCLNLFKLIAALQVMYGHIVIHLDINSNIYFDKFFGVFQGVPIFFALSGFLIWFSIERTKDEGYLKYIKKRFWRIYPEMWVAVAVEIIVMCIIYNEWNVKDTALFTLTQSTFFQFWTPNSLRGYGCGTPNGSLWTICVTIQYYIIAWLVYKLMKNRKWFVWVIVIIASIILGQLGKVVLGLLQNEIILKLYDQLIISYLWLFLLGNGLACFFEKIIVFCKKWWPAFFLVGVVVTITDFDYSAKYGVLSSLFIILAIIGFSYRFPQLKLKYDISFGIFIYHMTVVNFMITFGWTGRYIYLLIAVAVSCVLGYVSTITIGSYSAKKKLHPPRNGVG